MATGASQWRRSGVSEKSFSRSEQYIVSQLIKDLQSLGLLCTCYLDITSIRLSDLMAILATRSLPARVTVTCRRMMYVTKPDRGELYKFPLIHRNLVRPSEGVLSFGPGLIRSSYCRFASEWAFFSFLCRECVCCSCSTCDGSGAKSAA